MDDLISRQAAIDALAKAMPSLTTPDGSGEFDHDIQITDEAFVDCMQIINELPSAEPEGWVKIPDTGIDDLSDGFHTFRQLYYQRMMLFATIVRQNREKAWKSLRHEDGELCFGGGWFIVGIDTPEGSYTYHYEDKYFDLFDCVELPNGKEWDGHTEKDVTRLLSLPSVQPEQKHGRWVKYKNWYACSECGKEMFFAGTYDESQHYCYNCGARMEEQS